jgi:hypothetical protein
MNILWKGATGPMVKALQKSLAKQTLPTGPVEIDGVFGPRTEITVKAFQKAMGLPADGVAGPATLARLGLSGPPRAPKAHGRSRADAAVRVGARAPTRGAVICRAELVEEEEEDSPDAGLAIREEPRAAKTAVAPRTLVFVSYSHVDAKWLKRLQVFLAPLKRQGMVDEWDDTRIQAGMKWREEIAAAIRAAKAAVLLLSADFCASDFIAKDELPPLLAAAEKGKTAILCVVVSPCDPGPLASYQLVNPPSKTLAEMTPPKRERVWLKLVESVTTALNR